MVAKVAVLGERRMGSLGPADANCSLPYSTGKYIPHPLINHNGKE